jgi:ssDNA-binding Zn-finger/Zn-ribbon topoisomerase 1
LFNNIKAKLERLTRHNKVKLEWVPRDENERADELSHQAFLEYVKGREGWKEVTMCECGGVMVLRDGKKGKFYGCSHYPKCKNTKPYGQAVDVADLKTVKTITSAANMDTHPPVYYRQAVRNLVEAYGNKFPGLHTPTVPQMASVLQAIYGDEARNAEDDLRKEHKWEWEMLE